MTTHDLTKSDVSAEELCRLLDDARERTLAIIDPMEGDQLMGPQLDIVNPPLWEIGHLAWFHEKWTLRDIDGDDPLRSDADELYDSIAIGHDNRWELPLPDYGETREYMAGVRRAMQERLEGREPTDREIYRYRYTTFHEDMHTEAFTYTRQTLAYSAPTFAAPDLEEAADFDAGGVEGDVEVPGGTLLLGSPDDRPFAFDNERRAHTVEVEPFEISRAQVTNAEFREFVEDGGYDDRAYWSDAGWEWRKDADADSPVYWQKDSGEWHRRLFDEVVELKPHRPVVHVSYWEAEAYCNWAGRRLPTEAEWEAAAAGLTDDGDEKRRFPWGDRPPTGEHANLDGLALIASLDDAPDREVADVGAFPEGDSPYGCRQMVGNTWEWTASTFEPYPDFEPDMYEAYSQPWFGDRKVLKGGAWGTRGRMVHNMWRNYFEPQRRDVLAGFRTCAR